MLLFSIWYSEEIHEISAIAALRMCDDPICEHVWGLQRCWVSENKKKFCFTRTFFLGLTRKNRLEIYTMRRNKVYNLSCAMLVDLLDLTRRSSSGGVGGKLVEWRRMERKAIWIFRYRFALISKNLHVECCENKTITINDKLRNFQVGRVSSSTFVVNLRTQSSANWSWTEFSKQEAGGDWDSKWSRPFVSNFEFWISSRSRLESISLLRIRFHVVIRILFEKHLNILKRMFS